VKFLWCSFVTYSLRKKHCSDNLKLLIGTVGIKVGIPRLHMISNVSSHKEQQHIKYLPENCTDDIKEDCKNEHWDDEPRKYQANKKNSKQNNPQVL